MDPWKELAALEECRDAVRASAELEDSSPQAADVLMRQYNAQSLQIGNWQLAIGLGMKLAAWVYETWWHITRR
jgi:hypothetical protein